MKFALITEGASEHRVIKHIISRYFRDEDPDVNQIQPKIVNDKQETPGGWNEVLKYCTREELRAILVENDYLIIQIDTDQSATRPFNIGHTHPNGNVKTQEELYLEVKSKLDELIRPEIKVDFGHKIFFAICIHTIECWLLPIVYTTNRKKDIANCISTLNSELARQNMAVIPPAAKNKPNAIKAYNELLRGLMKKKDINEAAENNFGFKKFIASLKNIG